MSKIIGNVTTTPVPRSDWGQNDKTKVDFIRNRTHYESEEISNEPLSLTWDGNTEGLVSTMDYLYKISDMVFTDDEIKLMTVTLNVGESINLGTLWDEMICTEDIVGADIAIFVRKDGAVFDDIVFPEKGIYVFLMDGAFVSSITTDEPINCVKKVVHKLDNKFIDAEWMATDIKVKCDPYFDGDITNRTAFQIADGFYLVKITDYVPSEKECIGASVVVNLFDVTETTQVVTKTIDFTEQYGLPSFSLSHDREGYDDTEYVVVVKKSGTTQGIQVDAGTYYLYVNTPGMDGGKMYVKYCSVLENATKSVPNKLPMKYLPEGYPYFKAGGNILEETTLTANENGEMLIETIPSLEVGMTYIIVYNGIEYTCESIDGATLGEPGMVVLGNYSLVLGTGDTGEPFMLVYVQNYGCMIGDLTGATSCTLSIRIDEILYKLDNKFIDAEWMATSTKGKGNTILPEAEYECNATIGNGGFNYHDPDFEFVNGKEYIISVDGVETIGKAMYAAEINGYLIFSGNTKVIHFGNFISVDIGVTGTHSFAIYEYGEVPNKLPKKFLPDDIGGTPDWNAMEGETGYIKNRTHWTDREEVEFFPEGTYACDYTTEDVESNGYGEIFSPDTFVEFNKPIEVGKKYSVRFDGTDYEVTGKIQSHGWIVNDYGDTVTYVGNLALFIYYNNSYEEVIPAESVDTGEPFLFFIYPDGGGSELIYSDAYANRDSLEFGIKEVYETIHKLDKKYLPDVMTKDDRTHWANENIITILPQANYIIESGWTDGYGYEASYPLNAIEGFIEGQKYLVQCNGVEYECVGIKVTYSDETLVGIGNPQKVLDTEWGEGELGNNGLPFWIEKYESDDGNVYGAILYGDSDCYDTINIGISRIDETVNQLDNKYLQCMTAEDCKGYTLEIGELDQYPSTLLETFNSGDHSVIAYKISSRTYS